jgi:hypothetical protein
MPSDVGLLTPTHSTYGLQPSCDILSNNWYVANEPSDRSKEVSEQYKDAVEFDYEADKRPAHQD